MKELKTLVFFFAFSFVITFGLLVQTPLASVGGMLVGVLMALGMDLLPAALLAIGIVVVGITILLVWILRLK
jgi:hypothetical protein